MTLDDDDSWAIIYDALKRAEWTDDEINNITHEQLEKVVIAINDSLQRAHDRTSSIVQAGADRCAEVWRLYEKAVLEATDENGAVDAQWTATMLTCAKLAEKTIIEEVERQLSENKEGE
jgi:hypothetical protein